MAACTPRTDALRLAAPRFRRGALLVCAAAALVLPAFPQTRKGQTIGSGQTVRHHREQVSGGVNPAVDQAEAAIEKNDFAAAEPLLTQAVAAHPDDFRAWYDLGYVHNALGHPDQAIEAYRKAVALKADIFESNLNLGILLAKQGNPDAETFLRHATTLKPTTKPEEGLQRAWLSLGHVLETKDPANALVAYQKAAQLQPKDPEPHISAGMLLERRKDFAGAEKEYRAAAALDPKSDEALAGIVNAATKGGDLPGAEQALREYLQRNPQNPTAQLQLGRVLALEDKPEALQQLEAAARVNPNDADLQRELATMYVKDKQFAKAEACLRPLLQTKGADPEIHYMLGFVLLQQMKPAEAEQELLQAVKLDPRMSDAYGDLATAAYKNKHYPLAIQALDARAKLEPDSPGAYFLRAQAYDELRDVPNAVANYKQFLVVANGKFPNQEWQARHRLIAIDPKERKKK